MIVPATGKPCYLVFICTGDPDDCYPRTICIKRVPVVAWNCASGEASPIVPIGLDERDDAGTASFLELPDGSLHDVLTNDSIALNEFDFTTLEAAEDAVLLALQEAWEKKHGNR